MKTRLILAFALIIASAGAWMDPSWQYRAPVTVNNSGSAQTDYQVAVNTTSLVYNNTGLVGSWHFSENYGTTFSDASGNGNTGTYNGETFKTGALNNFNFNASSGWVSGRYGTALQFDGVNDAVTFSGLLNSPPPSLTSEVWVRPASKINSTTLPAASWIFSKETGTSFNQLILYFLPNDGRIEWRNEYGGSAYSVYSATNSWEANTWYHLTAVAGAGGMKLYVNGVLENQNLAATGMFASGTQYDARLSCARDGTRCFNGTIDDFRLYGRALSDSEINQTYGNNMFLRNGLIGYWRLDEGAGTTAQDTHHLVTPDNRNGTRFGNALNFDGVGDYVGVPDSASLTNSGDFSVFLWMNQAGTKANDWQENLVTKNLASQGWILGQTGTRYVRVIINEQVNVQPPTQIALNTWYYVGFTYNRSSTNVTIYINGQPVVSQATQAIVNAAVPLRIGDDAHNTGRVFNGTIDEVRIYNRSLSAQEIQQLYNASKLRPDYQDLRFATPPYTIYEMPLVVSGVLPNTPDYMAQVNVTDAAAIAHMRPDGKDIRVFPSQVADPYGTQGAMNFWVEAINSTQVTLRVKANSTGTVYLYYGSPFSSGATNDGDLSVSGVYYVDSVKTGLAASVGAGSTSLPLSSSAGFGAWDEVLVIDMQGTQADYGAVGVYETATVFNVSGSTLALNQQLRNSYNASHKVMVQRVPRFHSVVVSSGGAITAGAWNGGTGGVIFFRAASLAINSGGKMDAVAKGYRGGAGSTSSPAGQGESVGGTGAYSTSNNLGGGGGAGPYVSCCSSGGAGGGYATAGERGDNGNPNGVGGIAYGNETLARLYLGSGGGGGEWYAGASNGAAGSGIIAVIAGSITNNGTINATGEKAWQGSGTVIQGGGGAGGSILFVAETIALGYNTTVADKGTESYFSMGAGSVGRIRVDYAAASGYTYPASYNSTLGIPSTSAGAETAKSQAAEIALPYWLESDSRAWVRVPSVPSGASTIYAYYGNPNAAAASNGTAAFDLFDDFPGITWDVAKWTQSYDGTPGSVTIANSIATITAGSNGEQLTSNAAAFSQNKILEVYSKQSGDGSNVAEYINAPINMGWRQDISSATPNLRDVGRMGSTYVGDVAGATLDTAKYHVWAISWRQGEEKWWRDGVNLYTDTNALANAYATILLHAFAGHTNYVDWARVRKYASPEPSLSLQQEETPNPALFVGVSPSSKTTFPSYNETFSLWVYNNQTVSDTFTLSCGGCSVSPPSLFLTPYQNGSATVTITSANVSGTTAYTITATSQSNTSNSASISASLTVDTTKWRDNWTDAYGNGFRYRVPITINNSGSALSDYQVNVTLDTSTPIGQGRLRSDCGDIRVTNGTNEMPYWIESGCNTTTTKIWARVPSVPAGNSTIYAYYGNANLANSSNGTATFAFFDDFESGNLNKWDVSSGASISTSLKYEGSYGAALVNNPGLRKNTTEKALEFWFYDDMTTADYWYGYDDSKLIGKGYYDATYAVYIATNYYSTGISRSLGWHRGKILVKSSSMEFYVDGALGYTYSGAFSPTYATFYLAQPGGTSAVDLVRVRRYASPEPTALAGAEQSKGYRTLVRRCGLKQPGANVTAYVSGNATASCVSDSNGICSLGISAGTYDLQFRFADNSTAWKNATAFG